MSGEPLPQNPLRDDTCPEPGASTSEAEPRTLTIHTEIIFGAVRLDPGTYEVRRVSPVASSEPEF